MSEHDDHRTTFMRDFRAAVAADDKPAADALLANETWKLDLESQRMLWDLWSELDGPAWARDALKNAMVAQEDGECVDPHAINLARCPYCFRLCAFMVVDVCEHYVAFTTSETPLEDGLASRLEEIEELREYLGVQFAPELTDACPRIQEVVALAAGGGYLGDADVWEFISGGKMAIGQHGYDGYGYLNGIALFHESPEEAEAMVGYVRSAVEEEHDRLTQLSDDAD